MEVPLEFTMTKAELLHSLRKSDYLEEYGDILKAVGDGSYAPVDKELRSLTSSGILRQEVQTCIPRKRWVQCCSGLMMLEVNLDQIPAFRPSGKCSTLAYVTQSRP